MLPRKDHDPWDLRAAMVTVRPAVELDSWTRALVKAFERAQWAGDRPAVEKIGAQIRARVDDLTPAQHRELNAELLEAIAVWGDGERIRVRGWVRQ